MKNPLPIVLYGLKATFTIAALFIGIAQPLQAQTITIKTLDVGSGTTGQHTSQAIVDGNPAIAYYNVTEGNLMFARSSGPDGSGDWTIATVDATGDVGQFASLAIVDGNPAISYHETGRIGRLKYVRALDASGTNWGLPMTIQSGNSELGMDNSLAVVNGNPAISYYGSSLKYVRALDARGTTWSAPITLDSTTTYEGKDTSLRVVNGNPAISYYEDVNDDLKYIRASNANGTSWDTPMILDSTGIVGWYTSLEIVNGNPAISYYDSTNGDLKFMGSIDANGTSWNTPVIVDSVGSVGRFASLRIIKGNPAISYSDLINSSLKYIRALDASGTNWGTPITVDGSGWVGTYSSLADVNGNPAISYYDGYYGNLKWAMLTFDADSDGLLDSWEIAQFGTSDGHGPLDDADHDGICELLELAFGMNPTIPDAGGLPIPVNEGGYLTMTITKQAGVTYEVQSAGSLLAAQPDSFSAATTMVITNSATTLKVRDNFLIGTSPPRFMRVKVTAAP